MVVATEATQAINATEVAAEARMPVDKVSQELRCLEAAGLLREAGPRRAGRVDFEVVDPGAWRALLALAEAVALERLRVPA